MLLVLFLCCGFCFCVARFVFVLWVLFLCCAFCFCVVSFVFVFCPYRHRKFQFLLRDGTSDRAVTNERHATHDCH